MRTILSTLSSTFLLPACAQEESPSVATSTLALTGNASMGGFDGAPTVIQARFALAWSSRMHSSRQTAPLALNSPPPPTTVSSSRIPPAQHAHDLPTLDQDQ